MEIEKLKEGKRGVSENRIIKIHVKIHTKNVKLEIIIRKHEAHLIVSHP